MTDKTYDLIIVGAGPAGLTAAIYAANSGIDFLVVSGFTGSAAATAPAVANYPGVPVRKLAIISRQGDEFGKQICSPCGSCRQVICECEARYGAPIEILLCSDTEVYVIQGIEALLPFGFGPKELNK